MQLNEIQLYQFRNFNMEEFTEKYLYEVNPHEDIDETTLSVYAPPETIVTARKRGVRSESIIADKCRYLQDAIIRRAYSRKDDRTVSLNSQILKSVIGNEYKVMLDVLIETGHIAMGDGKGGTGKYWYYSVGDYSFLYTLLNTDIVLTNPFINARIQGYKEKTLSLIRKMSEKYASSYVGEDFLKNYIRSLKYVRINDYSGLMSYINSSTAKNPDSSIYYDFIFSELEQRNRSIYRIDTSHRFYHVLTNLDRNMKRYLSIDFMLDCKNSHPLLFNHFIFQKYGISHSVSYRISSFLKEADISSIYTSSSSMINHNVGQYFCNLLINNGIAKQTVAKMAPDEIEYIYKTSSGILWDEICALHPKMSRSEVKAAMFGAVFYSKSPVPDRWNDYAKEFKARFPTVFSLIGDWKRNKNESEVMRYMQRHGLPFKGRASLSIAMMALESDIFTGILKRMYIKRWHAVHIHDCIVVPDDGCRNHPTVEQVKEIMTDVYKDFGLAPTLDCTKNGSVSN